MLLHGVYAGPINDGLDVVFKNIVLEQTLTPHIEFSGHHHNANGMLLAQCSSQLI